jgi:hypothetical protein
LTHQDTWTSPSRCAESCLLLRIAKCGACCSGGATAAQQQQQQASRGWLQGSATGMWVMCWDSEHRTRTACIDCRLGFCHYSPQQQPKDHLREGRAVAVQVSNLCNPEAPCSICQTLSNCALGVQCLKDLTVAAVCCAVRWSAPCVCWMVQCCCCVGWAVCSHSPSQVGASPLPYARCLLSSH